VVWTTVDATAVVACRAGGGVEEDEEGVTAADAARSRAVAIVPRRSNGRAVKDLADMGCGLTVVGEVASSWPDRLPHRRWPRTRSM
jgi:hypothetical protein